MSALIVNSNRSVIPRWRKSHALSTADEALPLVDRPMRNLVDGWSDVSYADWKLNGGVGYLADAFSAAVFEGNDRKKELARAVLLIGDRAPKYLQQLARALLDDAPVKAELTGFDVSSLSVEVLSHAIGKLKDGIAFSERNPFLWHDLSFIYTLLGEGKKAERAMLTAVQLGNSHRLIVRSAARLFVHQDKSEKALEILARAEGFARDPWLLSAHVAISQELDIPSNYFKRARALYENSSKGRSWSELGMALATEELMYGKNKAAKLFARQSKVGATENAMAQGVWLGRRLNISLFDHSEELQGRAYEAMARDSYNKGEWANCLKNSISWLEDQPFSGNAALFASFVASTFVRNFSIAEQIVRLGLMSNAGSWMLRNNLVVSLAEQDRLSEAEVEFRAMATPKEDSQEYPVWLATAGLIRYRHGDFSSGRELYSKSYNLLKEKKDRASQIVSALYQSMEEARGGNLQEAAAIIESVNHDLGREGRRTTKLIDVLADEIRTPERNDEGG